MARRGAAPRTSLPARASGTLARTTRSFPRPRYRCINASRRTRAHARDLPMRACQAGFRSNANEYEWITRFNEREQNYSNKLLIRVCSRLFSLALHVSSTKQSHMRNTLSRASYSSRYMWQNISILKIKFCIFQNMTVSKQYICILELDNCNKFI